MSEEQDEIATNIDAFLNLFVDSDIDYHIGVITTDTENSFENGILRQVAGYRYLARDVPMGSEVGALLLRVGTGGSSEEMGLDATWRALTQPSQDHRDGNFGFLRDDAALHIIAVSDEEDSSQVSTNELANLLETMKPAADIPVTFSSIVGDSPGGCVGPSAQASPGARYISMTQQVGGLFESICLLEWTPVLEALAILATGGVRREYFLTQVPVPETLVAWAQEPHGRRDGIELQSLAPDETVPDACAARGFTRCFGWEYDVQRNALNLPGWLPPPGSRLHVRYEPLGGGTSR
jgi:hypothetical protein